MSSPEHLFNMMIAIMKMTQLAFKLDVQWESGKKYSKSAIQSTSV